MLAYPHARPSFINEKSPSEKKRFNFPDIVETKLGWSREVDLIETPRDKGFPKSRSEYAITERRVPTSSRRAVDGRERRSRRRINGAAAYSAMREISLRFSGEYERHLTYVSRRHDCENTSSRERAGSPT